MKPVTRCDDMKPNDLKERTKRFALQIIEFTESLPKNQTVSVLSRQLLRCGTSVGANYRSATRARSNADFLSRMGIVEEEADECGYWIELLIGSRKVSPSVAAPLLTEAGELVAIAVASIKTARRGKRSTKQ
jgi:four helix bundle protein